MTGQMRRPRPPHYWADVVEVELQQIHCYVCGDVIVRVGDRVHLTEHPDRVVCPECLPLAVSDLATVTIVEEDGRPLVTLAVWTSLVAFAVVASAIAGIALLAMNFSG